MEFPLLIPVPVALFALTVIGFLKVQDDLIAGMHVYRSRSEREVLDYYSLCRVCHHPSPFRMARARMPLGAKLNRP